MSITNSTSSSITSITANTASAVVSGDQVVRISAGGIELTMNTENLSGVFQVSRQNRLTDRNTVLTSKGEFPVFILEDVLQQRLGIPKSGNQGQALVAVESGGQMRMIVADSVSRPMKVRPEHQHPMPGVCFGNDDGGMFRSMINIDPKSNDPIESIRLSFDPEVIFGKPAQPWDRPNILPKEAASAMADAAAATTGSKKAGQRSRQLLAFIPEDISTGEVEHVFCLPLTAIAEVVTVQANLYPIGESELFQGFALWRKVPVPIVWLGKVFGFNSNEAPSESRRLVIARATNNRFIGFYAKPQMQTMNVPEAVGGNAQRFKGRPHLGCFRSELGEIVVPDMNRILDNDF